MNASVNGLFTLPLPYVAVQHGLKYTELNALDKGFLLQRSILGRRF